MIRFELLSYENIDAVWELEKKCFDEPWTYKMFESELDNNISVYIVAIDEDDNSVVAYAGVWLMYDFGDITNIAVHPDYRREGIAKKMLSMVADICKEKGIERLCLEVKENNIPAIEFYKSFGFTSDGVRKRYYQNKYDAYLMSLDLRNTLSEGKQYEDTCN